MKYIFCLLPVLICTVLVNAQANYYPVPQTVNKSLIKPYTELLYSGCAEGNCLDGNGTWLNIYANGYAGSGYSQQSLRNVKLYYHITKGVFKDSGAVCEGIRTMTEYPIFRTGEMEDYLPVNPGQRVDTSTADLKKGVFDRDGNKYFSNGELELTGKAKKYNYKKAVAWTQWGSIRYATVEYSATDTFKKFTGIVDEYLRPVYGVATYQNGSVFNGFFIKNTTGPGYYFKNSKTENGEPKDGAEHFDFMPDMNLFREAFSLFKNGNPYPIEIGFGDEEQEKEAGMPGVVLARDLKPYGGGGGGWIFGEDGKKKDALYTGRGIYYNSEDLFYFGSFEKGRPDGKGFLYYRNESPDTTIYPLEIFFKYGNFIQGFFNDGYFIYHKAKLLAKKALPQKIITEPAFATLALEANKNSTPALVELGDIYLEGRGVKTDAAKAVGYYKRAVTYGDVHAAAKLGALFENGDNSKGIQRDAEKAAHFYKRGAQMKASPAAPADAIKHCLVKYFLVTYPYLTPEQAAKCTFSDEYNSMSELTLLMKENWKRKNENQVSNQPAISAEVAKNLIGKIFFKPEVFNTGRNKWKTVTVFYEILGIEGNNASVAHSSTSNVSVRREIKPVQWFTDNKNGFQEARKKYSQCRECNGKGTVLATSTFKHTNDYEYTLGKKITYTATTTSSVDCGKCYGAGFCPADGSQPEWLKF